MFKGLFTKKIVPLTGAPAGRRLKTYAAQSGFVYRYHFEGHRPLTGADAATEFVFSISTDNKIWHPTSVLIGDAALRTWEELHARPLSSTEHYAIAKMALFQAFDERQPAQMKEEIRVRTADIAAIIETLGL